MLTWHLQRRLDAVPHRSFASLMELYEGNYILMRRLAPGLTRLDGQRGRGWVCSRIAEGPDLYLRLLERSRHTSTVVVTHCFSGQDERLEPDLPVRVYHDARLAEVWLPDAGERPRFALNQLSKRWESNHFLNRWLRYCLAEGHRFMELDGQALGA